MCSPRFLDLKKAQFYQNLSFLTKNYETWKELKKIVEAPWIMDKKFKSKNDLRAMKEFCMIWVL